MKTIEEAAIEYAVKESNIDNSKPVEIKQQLYAHELMYAFQAGVEFAQRWIPVEEELPANREKVLIKWSNDGREIKSCGSLVLDSPIGKYWQSGGATQLEVTHWRQIEYK